MQWVHPTAPLITTPTGSFASSCRLRQLPVIFWKIFLECKVISSCRFCWIANFSAVRAMLQSTTWILHGSLAGWVLLDIGQHHHGQVAHIKKLALWMWVKYKRMGVANTEQAPQCRNTNGKGTNATLISTVLCHREGAYCCHAKWAQTESVQLQSLQWFRRCLVCHRENAYCYTCKEQAPQTCTASTAASKHKQKGVNAVIPLSRRLPPPALASLTAINNLLTAMGQPDLSEILRLHVKHSRHHYTSVHPAVALITTATHSFASR